jgi:methionyl-tRNA synthetase
MTDKRKKFYITTSIPYTNASPHIGHALELIQVDVLARYYRKLGKNVLFLTGTDEHGQKTLKAAEAAGKDPKTYADEISQKFRDLKDLLNLSNDDFIRTTDEKRHLPAVYKLWEKYKKKGDIYKKKYKGFYCTGCEAFKTQKELTDNKCVIHQKEVEEIEEENYFFKLSKYLPEIKKIIEKNKIKIVPKLKRNEILGMIKAGIEDVSFSRAKEKYWGWPVPGDDSQVFYVWQDALPNYISAIDYANNDKKFKKYWPADVHCIGKDIVKFHCIFWPAMLLSAGLNLPKSIFIHGFINVAGQKMSKSLGNVIDPFELVKKYSADAVRYYLLREISPTEDGDFTYEKFEQRYNSDLAGGIGNLVSRTIALAQKLNISKGRATLKISREASKTKKECKKYLEDFKFNEALKSIWELIGFCDRYINEGKPWEEKENAKQVVFDSLFILEDIADLLSPFLPETSEKIKQAVKLRQKIALFPRV